MYYILYFTKTHRPRPIDNSLHKVTPVIAERIPPNRPNNTKLCFDTGENYTMLHLDLSWNKFRNKSAIQLIDGIKVNRFSIIV